jgi:flagellar L-ring protein FlgH
MVRSVSFSEPRRRRASAVLLILLAGSAGGCGLGRLVGHDAEVPILGGVQQQIPPDPQARRTGSLWRDQVGANYQFTDDRARFPGDLLTILIRESDSGSKEAATSTENESSVFGNLEQFFGLPQQLQMKNPTMDFTQLVGLPQQLQMKNPTMDFTQLVKAQAKRQWDGEGATARSGQLTARLTVEVKGISPNGNLFVQGKKIVAVNNEDQHVVLSGWVRPDDINALNEIESGRVSDVRIDYYGVGPVGRQQKAGWGMFIMDWVWPF